MRRAWGCLVALAALLGAGACGHQRQPVIPRAAFIQRSDHRLAVEGRDTTIARFVWPEFVGARGPEALDSLRAAVQTLLLAPIERGRPGATTAVLLDGYIARWNAARHRTRSRAFWRFQRRIEVIAETLGVVSLACSENGYAGGARSLRTTRYVNFGADDGRTLGFDAVFGDGTRDSVSAAIEPILRADYGLAPDSSFKAAGFYFADDRLHVNDNFALTGEGVRWHFDPEEIAPAATGPIDLMVPLDLLRPFARAGGPLDPSRR